MTLILDLSVLKVQSCIGFGISTLVLAVQVELGSHHQRKVGEVLDDGVGRRICLVLRHGDGLRGNAKLELHLETEALRQAQSV